MTGTATATREAEALLAAVRALRGTVAASAFPVPTASAAAATRTRDELVHQLDDYVLPRLTSLDAPLLAVVGGSTGAGKSTLVNSVVGERVTTPGVLRPTTRSPVLVHAPDDRAWFADDRVLPALHRVSGADAVEGTDSLRLVAAPTLPAGLALVDAPDIDSVVAANRALSRQLLAAADLWLFVTTAARYADAVPWDLLHQARERGTAVAVVLDRVPAEAVDEIRDHLGAMLAEQGLQRTPVFTVVEGLGDDGALPEEQVGPLRSWLVALAHDQHARHEVVRQTLQGALASLDARVTSLAAAAREQDAAAAELHDVTATAFAAAARSVSDGMGDGRLLRGEVLARWQEFVGTGEFFKQVESTVSRVRDRLVGALKGRADRADGLGDALQGGVATLVRAEAQGAVSSTTARWRALPGGTDVLEADPALSRPSDDLARRVESLVHDWQGDVLDLVRTEGQDRRTRARVAAYGVNALGTVLILVTLATTGGLTTAEVGIAGGTAVLGQRLLEAIFGDQAVRTLAERARRALVARVETLYAQEQSRYDAAVAALAVPAGQDAALTAAVDAVREVR
ncbi:dynamin family protein [Lapillicoccus jejuensis]|uniref:Dynamin family protein n=1 Tax=Lapillicoccus jejuensis TaxID=402171 RepID=A0A542DVK4_9MICO|nr:dynamin family protein [Lapillicoccus jejuensis]TQJ07129.1 dynamin family protein [Lapillicoccus jejuensis]